MFQNSVVRIDNASGVTVGTGFLITPTHVLTCAQVISDAQSKITVVFASTGDEVKARVLHEYWRDVEDIAILQLENQTTIPPVRLDFSGQCNGHPFTTFGFPLLNNKYGLWATGEIVGETTNPQGVRQLQLKSQDVNQGMSGAPIFDLSLQRVVGMVSAVNKTTRFRHRDLAFALPIDVVLDVAVYLTVDRNLFN